MEKFAKEHPAQLTVISALHHKLNWLKVEKTRLYLTKMEFVDGS
jgi:hypothetical protein